jgi:predicted secreted hydrolase
MKQQTGHFQEDFKHGNSREAQTQSHFSSAVLTDALTSKYPLSRTQRLCLGSASAWSQPESKAKGMSLPKTSETHHKFTGPKDTSLHTSQLQIQGPFDSLRIDNLLE